MSADDVSEKPETEANEDQADRVDRLEDRLDSVWEYVERVEDLVARQDAVIEVLQEDLRQEREERKRAHRELSQAVDEIEARTDMLRFVENADQTTAKQRSATLLQHIWRKAKRNHRDAGNPKAVVDYDDAEEALSFPDVERTVLYQDMDRVATWVENDAVCWYGDGELWLDLSKVRGTPSRPSDICGSTTTASTGVTGESPLNDPSKNNHG